MKHSHIVSHFMSHNLKKMRYQFKFNQKQSVLIYLRCRQDVFSFFIDSSVISGPIGFAHCSNPSQTNNSIEFRIFAHEDTKVSSRIIRCGNWFNWTVKGSRAGVSFPRLISMIGVTPNGLINYSIKSTNLKKKQCRIIYLPQYEFVFPMRFDKSELGDELPLHPNRLLHHWCQHWKCYHSESRENKRL